MRLDELPTKSFCILPWVSANIGTDGDVVPCCLWHGKAEKFAKEHDVERAMIGDGLEKARDSEYFQKIRQMMIEGKRPSGCNVCYNNEDDEHHKDHEAAYGKLHLRTIHHKRHASWPYKILGRKDDTIYENKPMPLKWIETGLSNLCNMACVMCNGGSSSIIYKAFHPGESIPKGFVQSIDNIDEDLSGLTLLTILGGEPMIEKKHDTFLETIIGQNKNPKNLEIDYHTNGSVFPSQRVIEQWKKVKQVRIVFSMDSVGKHVKIQRPGNYEWQDIDDTVDMFVQLAESNANIIFSVNVLLTALNIGCITETCDYLYSKLKNSKTGWMQTNRIESGMLWHRYIDYRNLGKKTKQRIKDKWKKWEDSNPLVLADKDHAISRLYAVAKVSINEEGDMDEPLTKELMLERHPQAKLWKLYKQDLKELDI